MCLAPATILWPSQTSAFPWRRFSKPQVFQTDEEAASSIQPDAQAGDVIFVDQNEDGVINAQDKCHWLSPPQVHYGFNVGRTDPVSPEAGGTTFTQGCSKLRFGIHQLAFFHAEPLDG